MPVFAYKAYDTSGRQICGELTADSAASGREQLLLQGVQLLDFKAIRFAIKRPRSLQTLRSAKNREQVGEFARQLAMLVRVGVTVIEALDVLVEQATGKFGTIVRDVRERTASGIPLSEALEHHPQWFDQVFCSAVKVGQVSGQLDVALLALASFIRESQQLRNRLTAALTYPAMLLVLSVGVIIFLMSYVIPQLLHVLESSGRPLPEATAFLKSISDVIVGYWPWLIGGVATIFTGAALFLRWSPGRSWWHSTQMKLPVIGPLIQKALIAEFAQKMSLLLRTGVPAVEAVDLLIVSTRHDSLRNDLVTVSEVAKRGGSMSDGLQNARVFPPTVRYLLNVGQETGELANMLQELEQSYATEVKLAIGRVASVLEPALIVIMAVVVGFIVFATMLPILEATRAMQ